MFLLSAKFYTIFLRYPEQKDIKMQRIECLEGMAEIYIKGINDAHLDSFRYANISNI
jgi:hypothetical protein